MVARERDESLEKFARPGEARGELLGMTLHSDDQSILGLNAFHGAVLPARGLVESWRQPSNRLMVKAVHANLVLAGRTAQLGERVHLDGVSQVATAVLAHVVTTRGPFHSHEGDPSSARHTCRLKFGMHA